MLVLVMYESMFGNSERIARAIAEGLGESVEVRVRDVATTPPAEIPDGVELLVVGGPTHAFSMSRPTTREEAIRQGAGQGLVRQGLREWLEPIDGLDGLAFATFDTRVSRVRRLPGSAARSATRVLRRHGGRSLVPSESFFVDDVPGPLASDETARARAWGRRLAGLALAEDDRAGAR